MMKFLSSHSIHDLPHFFLVGLLSAICGLGIFSTYIILPCLPQITEHFAANDLLVKLTIAVGFLGAGLGQLILGPFSDFFGRRRLSLFSLVLFIIGSFGAGLSEDIFVLLFMRFLQGISAGTCLAIVRAIARDLFSGIDFAKFMLTIIMVISVSPAIAPILGGYLESFFDWRAPFYFMGVITIPVLIVVFFVLAETNSIQHDKSSNITTIIKGIHENYRILGRNSFFLANCMVLGLAFSTTICMSTMFPFIFNDFGWSEPAIGFVTAVFAIGNILGSSLSRFMADRMPGKKLIYFGLLGNFVIAGLSYGAVLLWGMNPFVLLAIVIGVLCLTMLVQSNSSVLALADHPQRAGTASSFLGGIHIGSGTIGAVLAGIIPDTMPNLFLVNLGLFFIGFLIFYRFVTSENR